MRRFVMFVAPVLTVLLLTDARPAAAIAPSSPDLGMARLADLEIDNTSDRRALLRFSSTIVNVGSGPFELSASRSSSSDTFSVTQRVYNSDGSSSEHPVPVEMVFGGDGHNHWHVRDLASYELKSLDGAGDAALIKAGFCFFDGVEYRSSLPGAPGSPVYHSEDCGTKSDLTLTMGISVGWGDIYSSTLPDQYIEVTGLADGKYRLRAVADESKWFTESNENNNHTWVDLNLVQRDGVTHVEVIDYGQGA